MKFSPTPESLQGGAPSSASPPGTPSRAAPPQDMLTDAILNTDCAPTGRDIIDAAQIYFLACRLNRFRSTVASSSGLSSSALDAAGIGNLLAAAVDPVVPGEVGNQNVDTRAPAGVKTEETTVKIEDDAAQAGGSSSVQMESDVAEAEDGNPPALDGGEANENKLTAGSPGPSTPAVVVTCDQDWSTVLVALRSPSGSTAPPPTEESLDSSEGYSDSQDGDSETEMINAAAQTDPYDEDTDDISINSDAEDTKPPHAAPPAYTPTLPPFPVGPVAQPAAPLAGVPGAPPLGPGQPIIDPYDPNLDEWYVVWKGTSVGVFASWGEAEHYVSRISGSSHKKFSSYAIAIDQFYGRLARGTVCILPGRPPAL